jgi:hypothetical protein
MRNLFTGPQGRPLRLYLLGLVLIFIGAWAMAESDSVLPMALASSAGLMLNVPLLRQLVERVRRTSAARRKL